MKMPSDGLTQSYECMNVVGSFPALYEYEGDSRFENADISRFGELLSVFLSMSCRISAVLASFCAALSPDAPIRCSERFLTHLTDGPILLYPIVLLSSVFTKRSLTLASVVIAHITYTVVLLRSTQSMPACIAFITST
jgi:hypothetical protein